MKRFVYVLLAVAATLSLASCNQDFQEENGPDSPAIDSNTIALKLSHGVVTRSGDESAAPVRGASISLGDPADGRQFYLDETVVSLDGADFYAPVTKGTPVYTQNFADMSDGSFRGLAFPAATMSNKQASAAFIQDGSFLLDGDYWVRKFENDPWGSYTELVLFAKMLREEPTVNATTTGVLSNSYRYFYTEAGVPYLTFSYRSAATAQDMQDILFAGRKILKSEAPAPIPILFQHALTGVKFATAHENDGNVKTYIEKVEITGIYGYGKCTVTPQTENGGYTDQAGIHSSADAISWDLTSTSAVGSKQNVYYQEFSDTPANYAADGRFTNNGTYPASFSSAGNQNNLNDGDATMTFWFIPQAMTDDVKLTVTFRIVRGDHSESFTREVDFGTMLSGVEWKAGELRTYTLKAGAVDVDITDTVTETTTGTFTEFKKDNVVITNTGNVDAYIRAQIVANWFGTMAFETGTPTGIAFGYKTRTSDEFAEPWALNDDLLGDNANGEFTGLAGDGWVRATDGFFYFTSAVAPGEPTDTPLFSKYTISSSNIPEIWYQASNGSRQQFQDMYLVMQIPVQAVEAKAGYADYKEAWAAAGVTVTTD